MKYFFFLFFPLVGFSQFNSIVYFDQNWIVASDVDQQFYTCECNMMTGDVFDGPFECKNPKGIIVKKYLFSANVLNGNVYEFFNDGSPKLEAEYISGMPVGEWREWNEDGEIVVHRTFDQENKNIANYFQSGKEYAPTPKPVKAEEPALFGTECMLLKVDKQKGECSDEQMQAYYSVPPMPPSYISSGKFSGKTLVSTITYIVNEKGKVIEVALVESCGDSFLDELAVTHIENMIPFNAALRYGKPISSTHVADVLFSF